MEIFSVIAMKTKTDKNLYLMASETKEDKLEWTFDINEAIWFNTDEEANNFANKYFKNFNDWFITDTSLDLDNIE